MSEPSDIPTPRSIVEGTLAQALGGAISVMIVTTFASFGHYMQAGFESALGTCLGIALYILVKSLRVK